MATTTRAFVAIALPEKQISHLAQLQTKVASHVENVRWVDPASMHLTLAFLGEVRDTELNSVCKIVQECCREFRPFELWFEGIGVFPSPEAPRVYWAGLTGGGETISELTRLQRTISTALAQGGWPPVDNRFSPHVTIGRTRPERNRDRASAEPPRDIDVADVIRTFARWKGGGFNVTQAIVYSSILQPEGPTYSILSRAPFKG